MPKTLLLVSLLALVLPSQAVAGPPERVSGKMVLDEAADGLRRYRQATTPAERLAWLAKLAPTKDPRVTVCVGRCDGKTLTATSRRGGPRRWSWHATSSHCPQ